MLNSFRILLLIAFVPAAFGQGSSHLANGGQTGQVPDSGPAGAASGSQPAEVSDKPQVIILRPALAFSDYKTDAVLSAADCGGDSYAGRLHREAVERFQSLHITAVDQGDISDPVAIESAASLQAEAARLARGVLGEGAQDKLRSVSVAVYSSQAFVFVHSLKIKLGPHGAWQAVEGLYGPQMTTTQVQAALISCRTGRVVWQGQGFRRDLPGINTKKFGDLMQDLYKGLTAIPR